MTSQPDPVPREATPANQITNPLREVAAFVLLAANALFLFVGFLQLAVPYSRGDSFAGRADEAFVNVVGLAAIALPILSVLLATHIHPPVRQARLITLIALVEYAVSAVLAVVAFLGWLVGGLGDAAFRGAFTGFFTRVAYLAIFAIAAFVVFKVWRALYYRPRRIARPGAYGQPGIYGKPAHPQGMPPGYPPPSYDEGSGYGPSGEPGFVPGFGQPGQGQQPSVPAQPVPSDGGSGDRPDETQVVARPDETQVVARSDETQVLNRPEDESAGVAETQVIEPVQRNPRSHRAPEEGDESEPERR